MNRWSPIFFATVLTAGCSPEAPIIDQLVLSERYSACLDAGMEASLTQARIVEVIPSLERCHPAEWLRRAGIGHLSCSKKETTVYFGRLLNPETTDAITQAGWVLADTPLRIAKAAGGGYVAFTPPAMNAASKDLKCEEVRQAVVRALDKHMSYASK